MQKTLPLFNATSETRMAFALFMFAYTKAFHTHVADTKQLLQIQNTLKKEQV